MNILRLNWGTVRFSTGLVRFSMSFLSDRLLMAFLGIDPCMIEPSYDVDFTVTTRASPADDPHDQIIQFPK